MRFVAFALLGLGLLACDSPRDRASGGTARPYPDASTSGGTSDASSRDVGFSGTDGSTGGLGPSGVDSSHYYDELTPGEVAALCAWSTAEQGGARQVSCPSGPTVTIKSEAECVSSYSSANNAHCQVAVLEACLGSLDGDPCKIFMTTECLAFLQCGRAVDAGE